MRKGYLVPLFRFYSQEPTSKIMFSSVSPVTIPALTTIVDRQFKEDRTLCPVQGLRYYLDRTKDLRGSQSLLFSYSHFFQKVIPQDIRPTTLSSWLKQLIFYKQADQQSLDLVQVKAHDIRAFGGVFRRTKSCKLVTGKLTIHLPILPLRPYFVRL